MAQVFEWDDAKEQANGRKHRVSFQLAIRVFDDPLHLVEPDGVHEGEFRWRAMGLVDGVLVLLVIYTDRGTASADVVRIISARPATRSERRRYEDEDR